MKTSETYTNITYNIETHILVMKKIDSLILLINALSKSEKKALYQQAGENPTQKAYMKLFDIIDKKNITNIENIKKNYAKYYPISSLVPEANYLYQHILSTLATLSIKKKCKHNLYYKIIQANILKEKHLMDEHFQMLDEVIEESESTEDYSVSSLAQRIKLDSMRQENFLDISENTLIKEHLRLKGYLNVLNQINRQSELYELMVFYTSRKSDTKIFDDLAITEITFVNNLRRNLFEIQKKHLLFQGIYLLCKDNYQAANNIYKEANELFASHKSFLNNPPSDYMQFIENVLKKCNENRQYSEMEYYLNILEGLKCYTAEFNAEIECIIFTNKAEYYIHINDKKKIKNLINYYNDTDAILKYLTPYRKIQFILELSLLYMKINEHKQAKKILYDIVKDHNYQSFFLYRPCILLYYISIYELQEYDFLEYSIRSARRKLKNNKGVSKIEEILYEFFTKDIHKLSQPDKKKYLEDLCKQIDTPQNISDHLTMKIFDFRNWILSHV